MIRRNSDGTVEGSIAELAQYELELRRLQALQHEREAQPMDGRPRVSISGAGQRHWTPDLVRRLLHETTPATRRFVEVAMQVGSGSTTSLVAMGLQTGSQTLGPRIGKLNRGAASLGGRLVWPIRIEGAQGSRHILIDPGFKRAYEEASEQP